MLLPVEIIRTNIEGDIDEYAFRKLAQNFYRKSWTALYGGDFENNMLLHFNRGVEKKFLDKYTKIKLGRSRLGEPVEEYNSRILAALSEDRIRLLLHLCRFCSYTGGPGLPDILLTGDRVAMRYLNTDMQDHQIIFIAVAKELGYDVALYDIETENRRAKDLERRIDVFAAIRRSLESGKMWKSLAKGIEENRSRSGKEHMDEADFLEKEQAKMPFPILEKWLGSGEISAADLESNMRGVARINEEQLQELIKYESLLSKDSAYNSFSKAKTDENIRAKVEYFRKKFGIGQSKAIELLNWIE